MNRIIYFYYFNYFLKSIFGFNIFGGEQVGQKDIFIYFEKI